MGATSIMTLRILAACAGILAASVCLAQDQQPATVGEDGRPTFSTDVNEATFSVDVDVVNVFATVRDRDGHIIKDLAKDDFTLKEQNEPQKIKYFARQTNLPLTIGLLVDVSGSQINLIESERRASYQFLEQVLRPEQDLTFVIKFASEVELLQDLTGSREDLQDALRRLGAPISYQRPHFFSFQGWPGGTNQGGVGLPGGSPGWPGSGGNTGSQYPIPGAPPVSGPNAAAGTSMNDAIFLAADEVLAPQPGRKAVILISDGIDTTSRMSQHEAVEAAQRSDVIVYGIHYYDNGGLGGSRRGPFGSTVSVGVGGRGGSGADGASTLNWISNRTGGRMFTAHDERSLEQVFDQIEEELRNQYSIGYTPNLDAGKSYRKIKLATKNKKLKVQTREGYYPKS